MPIKRLSRRRFLLGMAAAGGGAVLAACQPQTVIVEKEVEKEVTREVEKEVVKEVPAPPGEKKELIFHFRSGTQVMELVEKILDAFETEFPEYKINAIWTAHDEYDKKTEMLVASGTPPAIWSGKAYHVQAHYADLGQLAILDPFVDRDGYDVSDFDESATPISTWEGKRVAFPHEIWPIIMVYNKTLFDEAGVDYPPKDWNDKSWTWQAVLETAKALTKVEGNKTVQFGLGGLPDKRYAVRNLGTNYFTREAMDSHYPDKLAITPELEDALQFMVDMQIKWKVVPSPAQAEALRAGSPDLFMTGKVGMAVVGPWVFQQYSEIEAFEWDAAPLPWPTFSGHDLERFDWFYVDALSIFRGCWYPEGAWELVKFLMRPENLRIYPLGSGALPPRKSVFAEWPVYLNQTFGTPPETSQVGVDGMASKAYLPTNAVYLPRWTEMYQKGIEPHLDRILLGETSVAEGLSAMEPIVNQLCKDARAAKGL